MDKLCRRITAIYLISYVYLIRFLLALTLVFSKTKMFKLLCLSYVLLNNYWATLHWISIFIKPSKVLSKEGKLSGGNSGRRIAQVKHINCRAYLFCKLKRNRILQVLIFANGKFLKISSLYILAPKKK